MPLQQNRTTDLTIEIFYSKWVGFDWESDHNSRYNFAEDLKSLKQTYHNIGYDLAKNLFKNMVTSL